jgi:hypothetical protein
MSDTQLIALIIGLVPLLLGVIFASIGLLRRRMMRDWVPTTGQVINRRGDPLATRMPARAPTFRWRDASGAEHRRTSLVNASFGPGPGKLVQVRYDPQDPSRAMIDSFVQSGTLFTIIGIVMAAMGVVGTGFAFLLVTTGSSGRGF